MNDITNLIKASIAKDVLWAISLFFAVIDSLEDKGYEASFWPEENCATLVLSDTIIGYIWKKYPFILIADENYEILRKELSEYTFIVFVPVSKTDAVELCLNYEEVKGYIDYGLSSAGFSAEDFCFYTNS
jgi:hypothetical protein